MPGILELGPARGATMKELADLVDKRSALEAKLVQVDADQRSASEDVERTTNELVRLEERSAGGEDVSDATRKKAEKELVEARIRAASPWAERKAGGQRALDQLDNEISRFAGANTRAEQAAQAATKLLSGGGEAAPILLHKPGQPRLGGSVPVDEETEMFAPEPA